ncbi:MAG TPA: four helix bundle protein [Pyrinomonadaceae bacterium]|nr:four helix bundle protein [Pyrinomonadaceae bacterium]
MSRTNFESLRVYQLAENLADEIWRIVKGWNQFEQNTVGQQIVRAADSIGANIAEGSGRGSFQDNRRFIRIARGSLNETQHWLRCAYKRTLLTAEQVEKLKPIINELAPKLNAYLRSVGTTAAKQTTDN